MSDFDINQSDVSGTSPSATAITTSSPDDAASLASKVTPHAIEVQPFRLFDLPDELWVRIGKMVIQDTRALKIEDIHLCDKGDCHRNSGDSWTKHSCELTPPAILQTCSWLRNELRKGYYRDKISIQVGWSLVSWIYTNLGHYLQMIGPEARLQIKGAISDDDWIDFTAETPEPLWERFDDWEIEMMLVPKRVGLPNDSDGENDHMWHDITFI